jgi:hypothetical protein
MGLVFVPSEDPAPPTGSASASASSEMQPTATSELQVEMSQMQGSDTMMATSELQKASQMPETEESDAPARISEKTACELEVTDSNDTMMAGDLQVTDATDEVMEGHQTQGSDTMVATSKLQEASQMPETEESDAPAHISEKTACVAGEPQATDDKEEVKEGRPAQCNETMMAGDLQATDDKDEAQEGLQEPIGDKDSSDPVLNDDAQLVEGKSGDADADDASTLRADDSYPMSQPRGDTGGDDSQISNASRDLQGVLAGLWGPVSSLVDHLQESEPEPDEDHFL